MELLVVSGAENGEIFEGMGAAFCPFFEMMHMELTFLLAPAAIDMGLGALGVVAAQDELLSCRC